MGPSPLAPLDWYGLDRTSCGGVGNITRIEGRGHTPICAWNDDHAREVVSMGNLPVISPNPWESTTHRNNPHGHTGSPHTGPFWMDRGDDNTITCLLQEAMKGMDECVPSKGKTINQQGEESRKKIELTDSSRGLLRIPAITRTMRTADHKPPYWKKRRKQPTQQQTSKERLGAPGLEQNTPTCQSPTETASIQIVTQWYQRSVHKACAEMMMKLIIAAFRMKGLG